MDIGQYGEQLAQAEYIKRGFSIIEANVFNRKGKRAGEIDFVARNQDTVVFVEVKTRTGHDKFGSGLEAVDQYKQSKIVKAVYLYLMRNPDLQALRPQIDVCSIELSGLDKPPKSVTILSNAVDDQF